MKYTQISTPTTDLDLISLQEAQDFIRTSYPEEEDLVTSLISAARAHVEQWTQRSILTQQWALYLDAFPAYSIELPRPVAASVEKFEYYDNNDDPQTLQEGTDFRLNPIGVVKSYIDPIGSWPSSSSQRTNAITIEFTAGWAADKVPYELRQAILVTISDMYENRQSQVYGMSVNATKAMESLTSIWRIHH